MCCLSDKIELLSVDKTSKQTGSLKYPDYKHELNDTIFVRIPMEGWKDNYDDLLTNESGIYNAPLWQNLRFSCKKKSQS